MSRRLSSFIGWYTMRPVIACQLPNWLSRWTSAGSIWKRCYRKMRKRWRDPPLFEDPTGDGVTAASAKSLAVLKRDGRIVDGRGGVFFSAPKVMARAEAVTFTTLRPERPPLDLGKLAQEVGRLKGLKKRQQIVELDASAKALGVPRMQLELMVRPAAQVVKNTERNAIQEAAKEKWRADYRELAKHPERLPVRAKLWEEARGIPGLTRQMFRDVISDEEPGRSGPRPGIRAKKSEKNGANSARNSRRNTYPGANLLC